jgi:predicted homoserine dehydrogenase-like protein
MMNYEADLMFGPWLSRLADRKGVVYTCADGDQPAVLARLVDEMRFMGFDLVMAGNIKGFLDLRANPTSIVPEADKRGLDHRMCTSYTDGTKLGVEMAVLANGLGLSVARPGMLGPRLDDIHGVFDVFDFARLWDGREGLVDYVLGARPKGGVFAIGYTEHPYQQSTLAWFPPDMGPGPFYLFYRPYHLGHFETMATVAEIALHRAPVLRPDHGFRTNVYAYAKCDLAPGETLDGIGGYACYGLIENCGGHRADPGLPICLAEGVTLKRAVRQDERIALADVDHDPGRADFEMFARACATGR